MCTAFRLCSVQKIEDEVSWSGESYGCCTQSGDGIKTKDIEQMSGTWLIIKTVQDDDEDELNLISSS